MSKFFKRGCVLAVSLSMIGLGAPAVSYAAIVGTPAVVAAGQRDANLASIRAGLERSDVRDRMLAMGVAPAHVDTRLASLSDTELQRLAQEMNELPAGGSALAVIGVVFVVLLVLELVGVIDIFKKR
jgi:hypothetical protein